MSIENFNQNIDTQPKLQDSLEYQEQLQEKVLKVEQEQKYATKLAKANDVLKVLDLPDNQDDKIRDTLMTLDNKALEELAEKTSEDIFIFVDSIDNQQEKQKQNIIKNNKNIEKQKQLQEIQKIKSILTPEILQNFSEVKEALNNNKIDKFINLLQDNNWAQLKAIIDTIWWANPNNPKYQEFKTALISIDPSFRWILEPLEKIHLWQAISTNEIINNIEKDSWWVIAFDLKSTPPVNKMSLIGSEYSFSKEIDLQALTELRDDIKADLEVFANGSTILNDFNKSFNNLLWNVAKVWSNEDFNTKLSDIVSNFSKDIFSDLSEVYQDMDIPSELQINEFDITSLNNINSKEDLQNKIEAIQDKSTKIKEYIGNQQEELLSNHTEDIKELLQRESNEKENQLETLKFMKNCWFDKIPKEISDKLIKTIQSNALLIPWLNLSPQNIDLENGHFWESSVFDSGTWLEPDAKTNMVKFMNKMISWNTNEPLNVTAIVNGTLVAQPWTLRDELNKAWIIGNLGWNYHKIKGNLRKEQEN